jgi:hypothetical protein
MVLKVGTIAQSSIHAQDENLAQVRRLMNYYSTLWPSLPTQTKTYNSSSSSFAYTCLRDPSMALLLLCPCVCIIYMYVCMRWGTVLAAAAQPLCCLPRHFPGGDDDRRVLLPPCSTSPPVIVCVCAERLLDASDASIAAHFLVVMRQTLRTLNGGTGESSGAWVSKKAPPEIGRQTDRQTDRTGSASTMSNPLHCPVCLTYPLTLA